MSKHIIFTVFMLLLVPAALAQIDVVTYSTTNTFTLSSPSTSLNLCQCESLIDSFTIHNIGAFTNKYQVRVAEESDFVRLSETLVELYPGESRTIFLYLNAACDENSDKDMSVFVIDLYGNEQVIEKDVAVNKCQNLDATLYVEPFKQQLDACESVEYTIGVHNSGTFTEEYLVSFGGEEYSNFFEKPYQALTLPAGARGVASASMTLDCSLYGDFTIPFSVSASTNNLQADLAHDFSISKESYAYTIGVDDVESCIDEETKHFVNITNKANITNTYNLSLDADDTVSLGMDQITLEPGQTAFIPLTILSLQEEQIQATLSAISLFGDVAHQASFTIVSQECYDVSINILSQQDINQCSSKITLPVIVKNTGIKGTWIWLSYFGDYAYLDSDGDYFEAGEMKNYTLTIDVPNDVSIDGTTLVKAGINELVEEDSIRTRILSDQACYQPVLDPSEVTELFWAEHIQATIRNDGLQSALYEINFEGNPWFTLSSTQYATLNAGQSTNLWLNTYQTDDAYQSKNDVTFTVKAYVEDTSYDYSLPYTINLRDKTFYEKSFDYFSVYPCYLVSIILLIIFVILALMLIFSKKKSKRNNALLITLLLIWVIIGLILYGVYGLPKPLYEEVPVSTDPLEIVFAEDTSYTLNLTKYFDDPDMDELSFEIEPIDNILVVIEEGIATLTPRDDWFGSRRFRITAYDGRGGQSESPRMLLEVVDQPEYTLWLLYERYCVSINLLLLLIVFLFLYAVMSREKDKKKTDSKKKAKKRKRRKK